MCTLLHRFILYSLTSDGVCNVHKFIQPALEDYLQTGEKRQKFDKRHYQLAKMEKNGTN